MAEEIKEEVLEEEHHEEEPKKKGLFGKVKAYKSTSGRTQTNTRVLLWKHL